MELFETYNQAKGAAGMQSFWRVIEAIRRHPVTSAVGAIIVLWKPLYALVDFVSNVDFVTQNWPTFIGFLDSGSGTMSSVVVGTVIIGYAISQGLKEAPRPIDTMTAAALSPPAPTAAVQDESNGDLSPPVEEWGVYLPIDQQQLGSALFDLMNALKEATFQITARTERMYRLSDQPAKHAPLAFEEAAACEAILLDLNRSFFDDPGGLWARNRIYAKELYWVLGEPHGHMQAMSELT